MIPKIWHIVVTKENQKEVNEWGDPDFKIPIGNIAGMCLWHRGSLEKGFNPKDLVKDDSEGGYDFGKEITYDQFLIYIGKKKELITYNLWL